MSGTKPRCFLVPSYAADRAKRLDQLENTSSHAFQHTFGTLAVENDILLIEAHDIPGLLLYS
jgi:integrase